MRVGFVLRVPHLKNFLDDGSTRQSDVKASAESRKSGASINSHNNRNVSATQNRPASNAQKSGAASSKPAANKSSPPTAADASDDFDIDAEVEAELSNMQRIESARAQWRQKEEARLEESWNALSQFDRNQKTRLSLDLENDILDEYLNSERNKPRVPTIQEEPEVQDVSADDEFEIPVLPKGRLLVLSINSTWGDRHYVGLNGVEIFTDTGAMPEIDSIRAEPKDINVLPEYDKDPRVVDNLLDGINRTRDDTHMWLAPFNKGKDHKVFITFKRPAQIAMIRIWVSVLRK